MKTVAVLFAAVAVTCVPALGQGTFLFNTHDLLGGNVVTFVDCSGNRVSGPDFFVAVFAGPDVNHLAPLNPVLSLDRTGAGAGFTDPFRQIYTVPGMPSGTGAIVAYQAFQ